MNRYFLTLFLALCFASTYAQDLILDLQKGTMPKAFQEEQMNQQQSAVKIKKPFQFLRTDAQDKGIVFLDLKSGVHRELLQAKADYLELAIPVDTEHEVVLELNKKDILAPGFVVRTSDGKVDDTFAKRSVFYHGKVRGLNEGWATLSVFEEELTVFINSNKGQLMLGKMTNEDTYVFYNEARIVPDEPFDCYTSGEDISITTSSLSNTKGYQNLKSSNCAVPIYIEVDYESYQVYTGTQQQKVTEITNYITGLFNQIVPIYADINVPIILSEVKVWTMADPYPKYLGSGPSGNAFQVLIAMGQNIQDDYNGRLAHLISIRKGSNDQASGGGAHTGVLCTTYGPAPGITEHYGPYAVSGVDPTYNNYPTYDGALGTVAHELGHNFGSPHTHQCIWGVNGNQAIDNCASVTGTNCSNVVIHNVNQNPNYESTQGTIMSYCNGGVQAFYSGNGAFDGPQEVIQNGYMTALNTCFAETFYVDADDDGFGSNITLDCGVFNGSSNNLDANDNNPNINPNTIEDCDNDVDDNGNGETDENTLALKLDGTNDEVSFGNTLGNFGTGDFTIEMRIKTTQKDDFILSKRLTCDGVNSFWQIYINPNGYIEFSPYAGNNTGTNLPTSSPNVADGNWHHIAITRASGNVKIFVDGESKGNWNNINFNLSNTANLTLGTNVCGTPAGKNYGGQIDELRIWNKALSSAAVDEFKAAALPSNLPGLVAYYDFNNPDAIPAGDNTNPAQTTVEDKTGNNDGTMTGFSLTGSNSNWVGNPAQQNCTPGGGGSGGNDCVNNALHFDGTNDFVGFGDVNALDFGTSNFTIEFWIKTGNNPAKATPIISKRSVCGCANFWNIVMKTDGKVYFEVSEAGCAKITEVETSAAINDGNWHHIAVTRSGATLSIFVDGNSNPTASTGSVANLSNSDPVQLGKNACVDDGFANYFRGNLDELRFWSLAKSQAQIAAGKDSELTGSEANLLAYYNFNEGTAGANNAGINTLPDLAGSANGTLQDFALSGSTSNWVENTTVFTNCGSSTGTCASPIVLNCGATISGNTADGENNIDFGFYWTGPELIYEFQASAGTVDIQLTGMTADLDLFLVSNCNNPGGTTIESSASASSTESINTTVAAGTYYIIIDGWEGAHSTFNLALTCNGGGGNCSSPPPASGTIDGGTYQVSGAMTTGGQVLSGSTVVLKAGTSITLTTGFVATAGSTFTASIEACQSVNEDDVAFRTEEEEALPVTVPTSLEVYPNPFQQQTTVAYQLEKATTVSLEIYDVNGRRIAQPVASSVQPEGKHQVVFQAGNQPKGIYFVLLRTSEAVISKRLVLVD